MRKYLGVSIIGEIARFEPSAVERFFPADSAMTRQQRIILWIDMLRMKCIASSAKLCNQLVRGVTVRSVEAVLWPSTTATSVNFMMTIRRKTFIIAHIAIFAVLGRDLELITSIA
mmetsp:Transcript_38831/g.64593  ORF Transcript_38831/g.64593 Transcript_38831/m.64593 type:complete len:115 (+) Transcript_38831:642-986(+)